MSDPVVASVAAYSDGADEYETTHAPNMLDRATRFASSLPAPSRILDAGCGPGRDLARFIARGHDAYGVDLNPDFVSKANKHAPTIMADLREVATRFEAESFDGIWAAASLVHLGEDETGNVLRQFAVLTRAIGKLYACVKCEGETGWLDEPDGRRWYTVWEPSRFSSVVMSAGFEVDDVEVGPFVEVWATRTFREGRSTPA